MQKQFTIWLLALGLMVAMAASAGAQEWAIKGDVAESCSCNPACPCLFGSAPTQGYCDANGLFEIKEGHYGEVNLDGISVVYTGRLGKWMKYYLSEDATDEQVKAVAPLIKALYGFSDDTEVLASEKVPVSVKRTSTKVMFSVPGSKVEIEMMEGRDGKPIKIENLPAPFAIGYTQYKSITNSHDSKDKKFSYKDTNGFTAKVDASSKK